MINSAIVIVGLIKAIILSNFKSIGFLGVFIFSPPFYILLVLNSTTMNIKESKESKDSIFITVSMVISLPPINSKCCLESLLFLPR